MDVARREGRDIVRAPSVFSGFVGVVEQPGIFLGVTESVAKLHIVKRYQVFRVFSGSRGRCGWYSGPFFPLPRRRWAWGRGGRVGIVCGGRRFREDRDGC